MLRHPKKVSGFFGLNTVGPWLTFDLTAVRHLWRFWYQIPISLPVIRPRTSSTADSTTTRTTWARPGCTRVRSRVPVHSPTSPQGTTMFAMVDGPIAGYAPEGELGAIADARLHYYIAAANDAVGHTQLVDYATDPSVGMHSMVPEAAK